VQLHGRVVFWYSWRGERQVMLDRLRQAASSGPALHEPLRGVVAAWLCVNVKSGGAAMFQLYRPRVTSVAIVSLLFVMLATQATPQPPTVQDQALVIEGRVLWVDFGSQVMLLEPAYGGPGITIDLHRIRQSDYHGFRGNEYVRVVGFILRPSRRVQAFELYLVNSWYPTEPQGP